MADCAGTTVYRRRRPEHTVLHRVVRENLETWLKRYLDREGFNVPDRVEAEFRSYLECGVPAYGFMRARCGDCGHDFLLAFSCKKRGLCPSCATRRMAETAAHLVDHVFPQVPVRQWVLSLPKRLRLYLHYDPTLAGAVLRIFLSEIERCLQANGHEGARTGAVSFIHRFGAALNPHIHFHCCVIDGTYTIPTNRLLFHPFDFDDDTVAAVQTRVRQRVLTLMVRRRHLTSDAALDMRHWRHGGGFSVNATVRIEATDRNGLERLLRYCARPVFASERLNWLCEGKQLSYSLPKPMPNGCQILHLTPLELLDKLAKLIPPPRKHRLRYYGVFAPNAPLRKLVTTQADKAIAAPAISRSKNEEAESRKKLGTRYLWASLLARIYEVLPLVCPHCGSEMRLIAAITDKPSIERILIHVGEPRRPLPITPARGPPEWEWEIDQQTLIDAVEPIPDYEFDQRISW
jgi:hypothetical protein